MTTNISLSTRENNYRRATAQDKERFRTSKLKDLSTDDLNMYHREVNSCYKQLRADLLGERNLDTRWLNHKLQSNALELMAQINAELRRRRVIKDI